MDEQMREKFEAWCRDEGFEPSLWIQGKPEHGYAHARVMDYWTGWQACAAALSQPAAADEWIGWSGGSRPFPSETKVDIRFGNGTTLFGQYAGKWIWDYAKEDGGITEYRRAKATP